jgi:hypothetical protein
MKSTDCGGDEAAAPHCMCGIIFAQSMGDGRCDNFGKLPLSFAQCVDKRPPTFLTLSKPWAIISNVLESCSGDCAD